MNRDKLIIGNVYFRPTYEDPAMARPVIMSYEYVGMHLHDEQNGVEPFYHFKYLSPFHPDPDLDADLPLLHMFSESDLESIVNLDGLIAELSEISK